MWAAEPSFGRGAAAPSVKSGTVAERRKGAYSVNTREIQNKKQRILIYLLVLIPFLYFLYIMVYPLGVSVYYSLTKWKGIGSPKFVGLANYKTLACDKEYAVFVTGLHDRTGRNCTDYCVFDDLAQTAV